MDVPTTDEDWLRRVMGCGAELTGLRQCEALREDADEILCMDSFVDTLGTTGRYGKVQSATVENVAEAIRFRSLLGLSQTPSALPHSAA